MATTDDLRGGPRQYQGSERDRLVGKSESAILFERGPHGMIAARALTRTISQPDIVVAPISRERNGRRLWCRSLRGGFNV